MADEVNPSSDAGATPTPDTPAMGTPASPGATPAQKPSLTLEEALRRIEELSNAHRNATEERDRHRKKLTAYEQAEQQARDAQLSEIERIKKQHADLESQHNAILTELQETRVQHAVQLVATQHNFIRPDIVARLIDWSEIEYEDGRPTNIGKLVEKTAKAMPELVRASPQEKVQQPAARGNAPAVPAMNPGRTAIAAPQPPTQGQRVSLSDAYKMTRQQ